MKNFLLVSVIVFISLLSGAIAWAICLCADIGAPYIGFICSITAVSTMHALLYADRRR